MNGLCRAVLPLLLLVLSAHACAAAGNIVFLVRTGTDPEGNSLFRQADARDTYLAGLFELAQSSRGLSEVSRYYDQIQRDKLASSLLGRGLSQQDIQYAMQNTGTRPVYIEVTSSAAGAYNDWKGRFSVADSTGQVTAVSSPRVVFNLGSDVARSGNRELIEQTLVHEIGHGSMFEAVTSSGLPDSPYLSKPHSGGSATDQQLAFIEGWAEFIGAYFTGRRTIAEDPNGSLDSNWYARNADGSIKSPQQLLATEGWNATVLYQISLSGKDQNAMWKMTQVMARTAPQSMWQLLQNTARSFPELAPAINSVVYSSSGGQIPGVAPAASYAGTPTSSQTDRLAAALYGDAGPRYAGYSQYVSYQQGQGAGLAAGAVAADAGQLEQMYLAKRRELDAVPWWKFWEKSKVKQELSMIEDVYARQLDIGATYQNPAAPSTFATPAGPVTVPGKPAAPKKSYARVLDALRSNDTRAATATLDDYRKANAARKAAAAAGPQGER